jgi:AraC-like DNA-binding protein
LEKPGRLTQGRTTICLYGRAKGALVSQHDPISVRFHAPPEDLRKFFTTFYLTEFDLAPGETIEDSLHPEWAGLRLFDGPAPESWIGDVPPVKARFSVSGPTSRAVHFRLSKTRFWGIGLLPLGWAQFAAGSAVDCANLIGDGLGEPAFAPFRPLWERLYQGEPNELAELARITAFFRALAQPLSRDAARIGAIHAALVDPEVGTVAELVDHVGAGQRTIERLCLKAFGFAPKLLLRRQRIMRSITQFMLDPSLKWIGSIDSHYHDQAQFVRDFKEFMGLTPREYAAQPHPVLLTFMRERARIAGAAVQTLDRPEGTQTTPVAGSGRAA